MRRLLARRAVFLKRARALAAPLPLIWQVTGQPEQRVAVAAAGTEEAAPPPEKPRKNEIRITHDED